MKLLTCGARSVASALALISTTLATSAFGQNQDVSQSGLEELVVTGSLIRGATEQGPLSIDVTTADELRAQGSPNITEFTRNLPSASEALGEPNIDLAGTAAGRVTVNLRGLGPSRTMVLLNGHRTSDDVSFIPTNALERVEILKDGAGVTYGAGAVGGVMNFVTRRDFRGLELTAEHKFIDGSDGESEAGLVWGFGSDSADILFAVQYAHQGRLNFTERDYGQLSFDRNPTQYLSFSSQPASYYVPGGIGTRVNDYDAESCAAVGGVQPNNTQECYYYYTPLFNFVDETENIRVFGSADFDVTESMRGRFEMGYSRTEVAETWAAPTIPPDPTRRGVVGAAGICAFSTYFCQYEIPISVNGIQNPYVGEFYARNMPGVAVPASGSIYTGLFWEPFALNGNPLYEGGARHESRKAERWGIAAQLQGEFGGWAEGTNYTYSVSGGMTRVVLTRRDLIVSRLQNALRGYGGPNCMAVDEVPTDYTSAATYDATIGVQSSAVGPGTNGCEWYNPFASSFAYSPVSKRANPSYGGPAYENSRELLKWIQPDFPIETRSFDLNVDVLFDGTMPQALALPGGDIGWAVGGQYRTTSDRRTTLAEDDLFVLGSQECPYEGQVPGQRGCSIGAPGPFWGTGSFDPFDTRQEVISVFGELRVPLLDSLEAQLAVRREDYDGFDGTVYKVAAKWQPLSWLGFRGSWSTNYAAPPSTIGDTTPVAGSAYISRFTTYFPTLTRNVPGTGPEEAVVRNFGILLNADAFTPGSYITATLDYFDFDVQDEIVLSSVTTVLQNIAPTGSSLSALLNCSAPHMEFAVLSSPCVQGVSTLNSVNQILVYQTNGPGTKTAGFELGLDYVQPLFGGDFNFGVRGTKVTKYEVEGYSVNGVEFDRGGDRLGFANQDRSGDFSSKLRGNAYLGYSIGDHNIRVQANYTKGVRDHRYEPLTESTRRLHGVVPNDYTDIDLHYRVELPWLDALTMRLSVLNLTNEDPMAAQTRNAYWTGVGNPRGRQVELGLSMKL